MPFLRAWAREVRETPGLTIVWYHGDGAGVKLEHRESARVFVAHAGPLSILG